MIWFVIWLLCAFFSSYIAGQKNRDKAGWFAMGFIFGPFALIAIAAVPVSVRPTPPVVIEQPPPLSTAAAKAARKRDRAIGLMFGAIGLLCLTIYWYFLRDIRP